MSGDINDTVKDEWEAETSTFQRVKSVVSRTYNGKTVGEIADRALVDENTARTHLENLAEDGFVETETGADSQATLYSRSWESLTFEQATDILENTDSDALLTKVQEMQNEIGEYREKTGLDEPEDISWDETDADEEAILQWKTTRRNLSFAKVALALDQAEDVV
ncbi:winged helix-turn-helix domain-containing protein [Natrialba asiatica]|uniref:Transcriptional regulator n=1 Tax=Natrialba asiatica (strain ATCC 700177 / DSM 12278 / JCM 9576 / FERM P-10747 / NBRC 102637 / 172P1) TaxID=29540 RepID=M0ATT7_NATA1|nr:winged helix-turn-helix domain-containing protein [Natrialba asiatica]ELZ00789.1 transcriptional regulator [Natrialba asiatica DSM 12278]